MSGGEEEVGTRLRRLEDLEEIRQLFVDYGNHLDRGDLESYAELFTDDGELLLGPIGRARGHEEIRRVMAGATRNSSGRSWHLVTNPIIRLDGDEATTDVMWTVIVPDASGRPTVGMMGRHRDVVVRRDGRWRFLRREGLIDLPSRYPGADEAAAQDRA